MRLLTAERHYPAEVEEVWDALTDPERVPRWLRRRHRRAPSVGGRYQLEGNAGGEVLGCTPPRGALAHLGVRRTVSWVDVTLTTVEDQTRLLLEHTAPVDPQMWDEYGPGAVGIGWEMALMGLDEHLLSPRRRPGEVQAWMAEPEGRAYLVELMTGCSEKWVEASIGAGTDAGRRTRRPGPGARRPTPPLREQDPQD